MLTWGQQSANSISPPPMSLIWTWWPCLGHHSHLSMPWNPVHANHVQHAFCFVIHRSPVFHILEGSERFMNWVCTFPSLSLSSYSSPFYANCPVFPFSWTLPYLFFSFPWTFPHLRNTCMCHNFSWALILKNSCVSVGMLYFFSLTLHALPDSVAIQSAESHLLLQACLKA